MSTTPTTYTMLSTGTFRMTDGSTAYRFTTGDIIPMELAIALGLPGAGYTERSVFNTAEQAAIEALIPEGGGGGGASFPMVEGVWYDQTYATPMQVSTSTADADTLIGGVFLIPTDCTISKVGLFPSAAPSASATALVGIYAISDAGIVSAQVGTTATVAVADSWTEGIVESATEIAVTAGWYFIGVASDEELTITGFEVDSVAVGVLGFDADAGHSYGYTLSEEDVHVALPATLVGAELALNFNAPQILFQITHD